MSALDDGVAREGRDYSNWGEDSPLLTKWMIVK
jgi:hypothetical protein